MGDRSGIRRYDEVLDNFITIFNFKICIYKISKEKYFIKIYYF